MNKIFSRMLEYQKQILKKISFDKVLFTKEIEKSKKWLSKDEFKDLLIWLKNEFDYKSRKMSILNFDDAAA